MRLRSLIVFIIMTSSVMLTACGNKPIQLELPEESRTVEIDSNAQP